MPDTDDTYIYDEALGEWRPAGAAAETPAARAPVRDAAGNILEIGRA